MTHGMPQLGSSIYIVFAALGSEKMTGTSAPLVLLNLRWWVVLTSIFMMDFPIRDKGFTIEDNYNISHIHTYFFHSSLHFIGDFSLQLLITTGHVDQNPWVEPFGSQCWLVEAQ